MHNIVSSAYETLHTCRAEALRLVMSSALHLSYSGRLGGGHAVTLLPLLDQGSTTAAVVSKLHRDVKFTKALRVEKARQPHSDIHDEMANLQTRN